MIDGPVAAGVLPSQWLQKAIDAGWVSAPHPLTSTQLQPASLDLRLGAVAHRLQCSFLPGAKSVTERLPEFVMGETISLREGAILERDRPYLIPLQETLALPAHISGRANPKSSTGRLDIFTRLITDQSTRFDDVSAGYRGHLYLEVVSKSFTVEVSEGLSLNQLRLTNREALAIPDRALRQIHKTDPLLVSRRGRISAENLPLTNGLFLSLDLAGSKKQVGWRAKKNSHLLNLAKLGAYEPEEFWEPVRPERGGGVILEPEDFYLLLSKEGVRIPPGYASEMTAFDPTSGELRSHYAGFFDPGFGHSADGYGSRAALEVRAHDVPFKVEDGQRICKLVFLPMAEAPRDLYGAGGSNYQFQTETLSKHFIRKRPYAALDPSAASTEEAPNSPLFG